MRRPRTLFVLVFLALPLFAQTPLVEKIDVSVVNVDVSVTDRAGNPVRGLTRDDFEIFEDGKPQAITNFYAVQHASQIAAISSAAAQPETDERFRRKVLVIVDNGHTTTYNRDHALERLEAFINDRFRGGEFDWSFAVIDHYVHFVQAPTSDKRAIHDALAQIRRAATRNQAPSSAPIAPFTGTVPGSSPDGRSRDSGLSCGMLRIAGLEDRFESTFDAQKTVAQILDISRGFAASGGKKVILFLTSDLAFPDSNPLDATICAGPSAASDLSELAQRVETLRNLLTEEANASNVNIYIINTEGLRPGGTDGNGWVPPTNNRSLYWLARNTGGRLMPGNFVAQSIAEFDTASSNFYSLGYRPAHGEDGKYHRIKVRIAKGGRFQLQYRDGYASMPNPVQLARALQSTIGIAMMPPSAIPILLAFGPARDEKAQVLVPMTAVMPMDRLQFVPTAGGSVSRLEIYVSIFDVDGTNIGIERFVAGAKVNSADAGSNVMQTIPVRIWKGKPYRIVVAVRDQLSDAVGVMQQIVRF